MVSVGYQPLEKEVGRTLLPVGFQAVGRARVPVLQGYSTSCYVCFRFSCGAWCFLREQMCGCLIERLIMKSIAVMTVCVTLIGLGASGCAPAPKPVAPEEIKQRESIHGERIQKEMEKNNGGAPSGGAHAAK